MKNKKIFFTYSVLFLMIFGTLITNVFSFTENNSYTDPIGDSTPADLDVLKVWIDNSVSLIKFKVDLNAPWNFSAMNTRIYACISVNNLTGDNWGFFTKFLFDYVIDFTHSLGNIMVNFYDIANGSNSFTDGDNYSIGYFNLINNNQTIEFGWKMNTTSSGAGLLNLSINQVVYIKFYAGIDSDIVPDDDLDPIKYIIADKTQTTSNPIPGFELLFLCISIFIIIVFHSEFKKPKKI